VLALHASPAQVEPLPPPPATGGMLLAEMPLFLRPDRYVNVPLKATYREAYEGMPAFWRGVLEEGDSKSCP
jgi:hypothetical protein